MRALALLLGGVLVAATAHAEPGSAPAPAPAPTAAPASLPLECARTPHVGLPDGPVAIGAYDGDLGAGRRACPRSEIQLGLRGGAIIDTPNFYGALAADVALSTSFAIRGRGEIFSTLVLARYVYAQNATIKGSTFGLGATSLGGSVIAYAKDGAVVSAFVRLVLPTDSAVRTPTLGGELGLSVAVRRWQRVALNLALSGDFAVGLSRAPVDARGGFLALFGVQYAPAHWFAFALDLQGHFGQRAPLDYLAPALALRFRLWKGLALELAGMVPVVGADRHDALLALRGGWRF